MSGILKRKRSDSEFSLCSSSTLSSPPRPGGFCFSMMDADRPLSASSRSSTPAHLPSRTMKRFRDSRPSDTEVHQHTLHLLFSAQQHQQAQEHQPPQFQAVQPPQGVAAQPPAVCGHDYDQPSLHSFWKLPQSSASSHARIPDAAVPLSPVHGSLPASTECEDCGTSLGGEEGVMDIDGCGSGADDCCCGACGKPVCFSCSISNLGDQRRCLVCAGRKVWIGGIGWTAAPLAVC